MRSPKSNNIGNIPRVVVEDTNDNVATVVLEDTNHVAADDAKKADDTKPATDPESGEATDETKKVDTRCGYGACRPSWIQFCNNSKMALVWLCFFAFTQGFVVNGINNVDVASLERRYELQSSEMGIVISAYDICAGILVLPLTYYGAFAHQPRMLGISALIMSLGSFFMALPQFIVPAYSLGDTSDAVCRLSADYGNSSSSAASPSGLSNWMYMFIFGQVLHGVGGCVLFTLGFVYLDSNVSNKSSPIYVALMNTFATLGPAVGYVLGGQLIDILYVDFYRSEGVDIDEQDPRWVGAWWIGYLVSCGLALIAFLGIFPFPRQLPQYEEVQKERRSEAHQDGSEEIAGREGFGRSIKDLPIAAKILLCNPTNMFITLAGCFEGAIIAGFAVFMPKFIQNQYLQPSGQAAFLGGVVAVPGAAGGQLLGGLLVRCFELRVRGILRACIILCLLFPLPLLALLFLRCEQAQIPGVNVPYGNTTGLDLSKISSFNLTATCNVDCGCSSENYEPVCASTKSHSTQFVSPCYAGCQFTLTDNSTIEKYTDCLCTNVKEVTAGYCSHQCNAMTYFLVCFFVITVLTFMLQIPALTASLRCIPDSQRSFGIGIKWCFIRFLGTVPGPIIFGAIFDSTCILWQEKGDERGACWIYDTHSLALKLFFSFVGMKAGTLLFFILSLCCYTPPAEELFEDAMNQQLEEIRKASLAPGVDPATAQANIANMLERRRLSMELLDLAPGRRRGGSFDALENTRRASMDVLEQARRGTLNVLEIPTTGRRSSMDILAGPVRRGGDFRKMSLVQALGGAGAGGLYTTPERSESQDSLDSRRSSVASSSKFNVLPAITVTQPRHSGDHSDGGSSHGSLDRDSLRKKSVLKGAARAPDANLYINKAYDDRE